MWIDRLLSSAPRDALALTARFAEARQQVLSENIANLDTPGWQMRRLDPRAFQRALHGAIERVENGESRRVELRDGGQVSTDAQGRLQVRPETDPAAGALFHDGTNASLEELMSGAAENGLLYNFAVQRLRSSFETLLTAARGRS